MSIRDNDFYAFAIIFMFCPSHYSTVPHSAHFDEFEFYVRILVLECCRLNEFQTKTKSEKKPRMAVKS